MKIEFLISTMNRTDLSFLDTMFQYMDITDISAVIINQCTHISVPEDISVPHSGIRLFSCSEKGLSKSRNRAIQESEADICLLADDDVVYPRNTLDIIEESYNNLPDSDVITFQIITPEGEGFKNYPSNSFLHNKRTLLTVSSPNLTFKLASIKNNKLSFDEDFGLGSKYITGEQNIFLDDCLSHGLSIYYEPKPIAIHPFENSGRIYSERQFISRGAVFSRIFKIKSIIIDLIFAIRKRKEYNKQFSLIAAISLMIKGSIQYSRKTK